MTPTKAANGELQGEAQLAAAGPPKGRLAVLLTAKLLEPRIPAREQFDDQALNDLIVSVQMLGIIVPLDVEEEGDNWRVHAGHRRLIVARALGLEEVPCMVYAAGQVPGEALKSHENAFREELNPAEEARYFQRVLEEQCGGDCDRLAFMVRRPRGYVEGRLVLLEGDPEVFKALAAGAISIGVAQELNRINRRERRLMYLDVAVKGGAAVRMVREWRQFGNREDETAGELAAIAFPVPEMKQPVAPLEKVCIMCGSAEDQWDLEILFAHKACQRVAMRKAQTAGEPEQGRQS